MNVRLWPIAAVQLAKIDNCFRCTAASRFRKVGCRLEADPRCEHVIGSGRPILLKNSARPI